MALESRDLRLLSACRAASQRLDDGRSAAGEADPRASDRERGAPMSALRRHRAGQALRRPAGHRPASTSTSRRRAACGDRSQRRRQDHADQPAVRRARARRRPHRFRRPRHHARCRSHRRALAGTGALVPDHVGVPRVHRAGERDAGRAGARRAQLPLLAPVGRRDAACASRRAMRWTRSASRDRARRRRWRSWRTASAASSRSR